jgi:uncharacterized membrane protein YjdF
MKVIRQIAAWMWEERKFWLAPIVAAMLLVAVLVAVSESSPLAPFIYPFF